MIVPAQTKLVPAERVSVTWEEPDCPLCGGRPRDLVLEAADPHPENEGLWFAVVRCRGCGLLFTSPRPDEASIGQFYPASYRPHQRRVGPRAPRKWYPLAAIRGRPCVERRALPMAGGGRLLDFGCGGGAFLERMARQGWQVVGLDSSPLAVERVRAELGLTAFVGTLPHAELEPAGFDVVTMWHTLEHVHRPVEVLAEARRLLAPRGRLFVAVPNIGGWPYRWFGGDWFGLDLPRHLTHFTPAT